MDGLRPDPSIENLQISMALYRRLLSLVHRADTENEIVRLVIDALWEQFSDGRVAYSTLDPDGALLISYSRQAPGMGELTNFQLDANCAPEFLQSIREMKVHVSRDIRLDPGAAPLYVALKSMVCSVARIDVPFEVNSGKVGILTIGSAEPRDWDNFTIQILKEVAELVHLMFREARTRERLRDSEKIFREFSENIRLVFWMSDPFKERMIYVSPAYEEIWGRSVEELIQNPYSFLEGIHPEDRTRVAEAVSMQAQRNYEETYRVIRPDGSIRWVKDRGYPIRDDSGRVYRTLGFAEDITDLHEAKVRLEATQAQVISNAKFAALGEMASGIAHEINNPLAVIHGLSLQLYEMRVHGTEDRGVVLSSLKTIEKMSNRIANITKGLRTFSRQTDLDPMEPADLCVVLRETMAICDAKIQRANVLIQAITPARPVMARCRASEISQVILNLLNNALDAVAQSPKKSIVMRMETLGDMVRLAVEDTGLGVDGQIASRIFQPFFTTKEVGKGTGLGLSISKGIVEAHGGRLFLEQKDSCTCFVIEFPLGVK